MCGVVWCGRQGGSLGNTKRFPAILEHLSARSLFNLLSFTHSLATAADLTKLSLQSYIETACAVLPAALAESYRQTIQRLQREVEEGTSAPDIRRTGPSLPQPPSQPPIMPSSLPSDDIQPSQRPVPVSVSAPVTAAPSPSAGVVVESGRVHLGRATAKQFPSDSETLSDSERIVAKATTNIPSDRRTAQTPPNNTRNVPVPVVQCDLQSLLAAAHLEAEEKKTWQQIEDRGSGGNSADHTPDRGNRNGDEDDMDVFFSPQERRMLFFT